jgi:hypothetical protein
VREPDLIRSPEDDGVNVKNGPKDPFSFIVFVGFSVSAASTLNGQYSEINAIRRAKERIRFIPFLRR